MSFDHCIMAHVIDTFNTSCHHDVTSHGIFLARIITDECFDIPPIFFNISTNCNGGSWWLVRLTRTNTQNCMLSKHQLIPCHSPWCHQVIIYEQSWWLTQTTGQVYLYKEVVECRRIELLNAGDICRHKWHSKATFEMVVAQATDRLQNKNTNHSEYSWRHQSYTRHHHYQSSLPMHTSSIVTT